MVFIIVLRLGQKQTPSVCVSPQTPITGASYTKKPCQECFQLIQQKLRTGSRALI